MQTTSGSRQNHLVRQFLAEFLLEKFEWDYWVTFTFGYKPIMEEVEDVLFLLYERLDTRILKHQPNKTTLTSEERSEWIHIPEIGSQGLHYHSFLNLKVKPYLQPNQNLKPYDNPARYKYKSYENEWDWIRVALKQTLPKLESKLSTLQYNQRIGFRIFERTLRTTEDLRQIVYSLKQYRRNDLDRFLYTIISKLDWKATPIQKRKDKTKLDNLRKRPNKIYQNSLESFIE